MTNDSYRESKNETHESRLLRFLYSFGARIFEQRNFAIKQAGIIQSVSHLVEIGDYVVA